MEMRQEAANANRPRLRLWPAFLAGPVIYALFFLIVYVVGEFGCFAGLQRFTFLGWNAIRLGFVGTTAVALLVIVAAGLSTYRSWRRLRDDPPDPEEDDPRFMLLVGTWLAGMFAVIIALSAVPSLVGTVCGWV